MSAASPFKPAAGGRTILLCVDGSAHSDAMVDEVLANFVRPQDALHLLIAWQEPETALDVDDLGFGAVIVMEAEREVERAAQRAALAVIRRLGERCEKGGHAARLLMVHGAPKYAIGGFVNEHPPDLLVVASRGLGAVSRLFLGSVTDYLVHHANCPVLVLKDKDFSNALRAASD